MPVPKLSDFPVGTKFFVKGFDVPVAWKPPDGKASSWFDGTPTHWDRDQLMYATRDAQQRFVEVPFAEFARLIEKSVNIVPKSDLSQAAVVSKPMTVEQSRLADARLDALMAKSKAARSDSDGSGRSDDGDFLHARRGANGLPDPDAD